MLLIWGIRTRLKVLSEGHFACPRCQADRLYHQKQARRWFTLFFIPIVPMKVLGEVVVCATCGAQFRPEVLRAPTNASLTDQLLAIVREGVVLVLGHDPSPGALAAAAHLVSDFAGREIGVDDVRSDLASLDPSQLTHRLAHVAPTLSEQGKERLVAGLTSIASTGGVLTSADRATIESIAGDLGLTAAHTRGVIATVVESV